MQLNPVALDTLKVLVGTSGGSAIAFFWKHMTGTEMPSEVSNLLSGVFACLVILFVPNPYSPVLNGAVQMRAEKLAEEKLHEKQG